MMLLIEAALRSDLLTAVVWLGLKVLRVRNPHVAMTAWIGVLLASLAMPLLMRWMPAQAVPVPAGLYRVLTTVPVTPAATVETIVAPIEGGLTWTAFLLPAYLLVSAFFIARLSFGLGQGLRLTRRAKHIDTDQTRDVRLSADLAVPVTLGGTILVPVDFPDWDANVRRAVLAHEVSHRVRGDFYVLLLSQLHRAVFWINPAAWWLHGKLADLAEANSDAAALAEMDDRFCYAQILIDLACKARPLSAGVAMARQATLRRRVERILAERTIPLRPGQRPLALVVASLVPAALAAAATVPGFADALIKQRMAEQALPRTAIMLNAAVLAKFTGYYGASDLPIKVTRVGDHLSAAAIGKPALDYFPESAHKFFAKAAPSQQDFQIDGSGRVVAVVLHQNGGELPAAHLDDAAGKAAEQALAARIAANQPQPGSEAALRNHIDQLQRGTIDEATLAGGMAAGVRAMLPQIRPDMMALGPVTSVRFQGVSPDGMDMYIVTHAHGVRSWQIRLTRDGRIESMGVES